jgi:hypothetical protein
MSLRESHQNFQSVRPNKGAAANRPGRFGFDTWDFMMTLLQMMLVASRSLSLVR